MQILSIRKPVWYARRSHAELTRWPLPYSVISVRVMNFWAPAGKPYDTLEEVIGIRPSKGSLAEYGVSYRQVELLEDGTFDYNSIRKAINEKTRLVEIQRSKGYQTRPSFSVKQIGELISFVKSIKPDVICMVDNCYGEFVDTIEPSDVGADMIVGSLIKNPGGGLGAYRRLYCRY